MTYFSDFPMPKEYPVFLPNKLVLKYLLTNPNLEANKIFGKQVV